MDWTADKFNELINNQAQIIRAQAEVPFKQVDSVPVSGFQVYLQDHAGNELQLGEIVQAFDRALSCEVLRSKLHFAVHPQ
jgi:hypothetical protein